MTGSQRWRANQELIASVSLAVGIRRGLLKRVDVPRESETRLAVPRARVAAG